MPDTSYRIDTMHTGLRLASLAAVLIGAWLGGFVIVPAVGRVLGKGETIPFLLSCAGGAALGLGAGWAVERYLGALWPSGRWLKVAEDGLTLRERSGATTSIRWEEPVDMLSWHFAIQGGRKWVPKGWYCVACRLAQADKVIAPYTFMKPADAQAMPQWQAFPELISRRQAARREADRLVRQTDTQEDLWAAEEDRWENGAEMKPSDFAALVGELDRRLADWPGRTAVISSQ